MKPVLCIVSAVAALAVSPALAQQAPPPETPQVNVFDYGAHQRAYALGDTPRLLLQCFDGQSIKAVTRSGARSLLLQTGGGAIHEVVLHDDCAAADRAVKMTARSTSRGPICGSDNATLLVQTPDGPKRCRIADVRRPSPGELAALSSTRRR